MDANDAKVVTAMAGLLCPVRNCWTQPSMSLMDVRTAAKKCVPAAVNSTDLGWRTNKAVPTSDSRP